MSRTRREAHRPWRDTATYARRALQVEARFVFDEARSCPMCTSGDHPEVIELARQHLPQIGEWPPVPVKPSRGGRRA